MNHPTTFEMLAPRNGSPFARLARSAARNLHWFASGLALILLVGAFLRSGVPVSINWTGFFWAYFGLSWQSVCVGVLLLTAVNPREILGALVRRYWAQKARLPILAIFAAAMLAEFGWVLGLMVIIDGIALAEWFDRGQGDLNLLTRDVMSVALPAAYFFCGLAMMFCYNATILTMEDPTSYDAFFNGLDARLLGGFTVSRIVGAAAQRLPFAVFKGAELFYYKMFVQVGAALLIVAMLKGHKRAFQFVGTLLVTIYLTLLIFALMPSIGPFAADPTLPHALGTYNIQRVCLLTAKARWNHWYLPMITLEEYIAFPSLHIALPVIVLWFVREWKRVTAVFIFYDVLLAASIILLEWHYVVDLIGGVLVAALAIYLVDVGMGCRTSSLE